MQKPDLQRYNPRATQPVPEIEKGNLPNSLCKVSVTLIPEFGKDCTTKKLQTNFTYKHGSKNKYNISKQSISQLE